jgi:hypothetical protein
MNQALLKRQLSVNQASTERQSKEAHKPWH